MLECANFSTWPVFTMKTITLTVFFEGTIFSIEQCKSHLYTFFHQECKGERIASAEDLSKYPTATHFKMGFDGCGVTFGLPGLLFGSGIDSQYAVVEKVVIDLIKSGVKVQLNGIGLSRGGITCLLLAKKLGAIDLAHLETNLLLLDPVPGNSLLTAQVDYFSSTLANQAMDVSSSKNLKKVMALYPYQEVGDDISEWGDAMVALMQVPIRPTYPAQCEVEEEVILGGHLNAFMDGSTVDEQKHALHGVACIPIQRQLSREIICGFLERVGALSSEGGKELSIIAERFSADRVKWTDWLQRVMKDIIPKDRKLHSQDDSRVSATNKGTYLNTIHRNLVHDAQITPTNLCLKLVPERKRQVISKLELSKQILLDFTHEMVSCTQMGRKKLLMEKILGDLQQDKAFDAAELSFILRDLLSLVLQQEPTSNHFFSRLPTLITVILQEIQTPRFAAIRCCISPNEQPVTVDDLRCFVLGRNDITYFTAERMSENLSAIEQSPTGTDRFPRVF